MQQIYAKLMRKYTVRSRDCILSSRSNYQLCEYPPFLCSTSSVVYQMFMILYCAVYLPVDGYSIHHPTFLIVHIVTCPPHRWLLHGVNWGYDLFGIRTVMLCVIYTVCTYLIYSLIAVQCCTFFTLHQASPPRFVDIACCFSPLLFIVLNDCYYNATCKRYVLQFPPLQFVVVDHDH